MTHGRGLHRKTAGRPRAAIRTRYSRSICATALVGLVLVGGARAYPETPELGYGTSMLSGTTVVPQWNTSSAFFPSTAGK